MGQKRLPEVMEVIEYLDTNGYIIQIIPSSSGPQKLSGFLQQVIVEVRTQLQKHVKGQDDRLIDCLDAYFNRVYFRIVVLSHHQHAPVVARSRELEHVTALPLLLAHYLPAPPLQVVHWSCLRLTFFESKRTQHAEVSEVDRHTNRFELFERKRHPYLADSQSCSVQQVPQLAWSLKRITHLFPVSEGVEQKTVVTRFPDGQDVVTERHHILQGCQACLH